MRRASISIVILTVFLDLIGFGIVIPLLPIYSRDFGASGIMVGVIMGVYSLMQFLFAPIWGRLSDRVGRRPILLLSTAGSTISYVIFAIGSLIGAHYETSLGLWILLGSRVLAGTFAANITVAQAYIADISPVEQRSQKMGLIGMAFGLGFIFGPALGGVAAELGPAGPGWVASALCGANFLLAYVILAESLSASSPASSGRPQWSQWVHSLRKPQIGFFIGLFFTVTFCFTSFETTLGLLGEDHFDFGKREIAFLFVYAGTIAAVIQGGLIKHLVKWLGEPRLIVVSLAILSLSLLMLPYVTALASLLTAVGLLAIGSGTFRPPLFGLISNCTSADEQGETIGVAQSAGSLARVIGAVFAGGLYGFNPAAPYVACGGLTLIMAFMAFRKLPKTREKVVQAASAQTG